MAKVAVEAAISVPDSSLPEFDSDLVNGHDKDSASDVEESETKENGVKASLPIGDRIKRKAKRPSKFLAKEVLNRTKSDTQIIAPIRALKNSRKSRNGFGRGLPKKGKVIKSTNSFR